MTDLEKELLIALKGMVAEFDKFSRLGSSIAQNANEARHYAIILIARAERQS